MIRVRIEMCPRGDEREPREIGRMYIANVGGDASRGDYEVAVCRRGSTKVPAPIAPDGPSPTRSGRVEGYPRLSYNVWRLIARAALSCFPEERLVARKSDCFDDPAGDTGHEPSDEQALELGRELAPNPALIDDIVRPIGHAAWLRGARPRGF